MKKIIYIFLLFSFVCLGQNAKYIPLGMLGNLNIGTLTFGTNNAKAFNIRTNNVQRISFHSNGVNRLSSIPSILSTGSGKFWYDSTLVNGLGFAFFKPAHSGTVGATFGISLTDSVIKTSWLLENDKTAGVSQPWFGEWFGTSTNHHIHFLVNNLRAVSIVSVTGQGGLLINPSASSYTTDARLRINTNNLKYSLTCVDLSDNIVFAVDSGTAGNVRIRNQCAIGSTVVGTATLGVTGTGSVSTTSTVNALICQTTFSAGGQTTLTTNALLGGSTGTATLDVLGTGSVSTTFTTTGAFNAQGGVWGTTSNNSATAGNDGEFSTAIVANGSAITLVTATPANVTSISLTAGDWDVSGNVNINETTSTVTNRIAGITVTSATIPTDGSEVSDGKQTTALSSKHTMMMPVSRLSLSGTTTVYLVTNCTFSAGTEKAYGAITARRIR